MSYRNIQVNGKKYQYVIGKANIHIRGVGDFPVKDHGNQIAAPRDSGKIQYHEMWVATPATVRALILGESTPVNNGGYMNLVMIDPFQSEIYGKTEYLPYDASLYFRLCDDI